MNHFLSFAVLLIGIHLVSFSSAHYEQATYSREQEEVNPASSNYNNDYVPKEYQEEVPVSSSYDPKDDHDHQDSPHDDHDQPLEGVFSLTIPTFLSDHYTKKPSDEESLSSYFYYQSCPEFEHIVNSKVKEWVGKDDTLAAALLRLHFHDCVVRVRSSLLDFCTIQFL